MDNGILEVLGRLRQKKGEGIWVRNESGEKYTRKELRLLGQGYGTVLGAELTCI